MPSKQPREALAELMKLPDRYRELSLQRPFAAEMLYAKSCICYI